MGGTAPTELVIDGHVTTLKMRVYRLNTADLSCSPADRELLRRLAGQVAELAARPIEDEKRELWSRHNALEPTRPVILCEPEDGWREVIPPRALQGTSALVRQWEMHLRKQIFWGVELRDDYVIEPAFTISHVFPELHWGLKERQVGGEMGGRAAITWDAPIKCYEEDLPKLSFPVITIDWASTNGLVSLAEEVFGDLLEIRLRTQWWWSMGLTNRAVLLRGLQQLMYDFIDRPQQVHRLMAFLRDGMLNLLDYVERKDLLFLNNDGTYVGSGGVGFSRELPQPDFDQKVRACDTWGHGESQESVGVSPDMFAEFIFPYELPFLERFGLNCYGCCEPVDKRWQILKTIPRLRRVSVSAWADWAKMAEMLGNQYIFSAKPSPAPLAAPNFDEEAIRADLRRVFHVARDCRVEVIMKDNHTLQHDPRRLVRWVQMGRQEAERA